MHPHSRWTTAGAITGCAGLWILAGATCASRHDAAWVSRITLALAITTTVCAAMVAIALWALNMVIRSRAETGPVEERLTTIEQGLIHAYQAARWPAPGEPQDRLLRVVGGAGARSASS